ncbi:MAG: hypothetical protein JNM41_14540 [Flavipsychrobacter sp.]|nr:hypothetical protein [Flavipsychrobacter sp.]
MDNSKNAPKKAAATKLPSKQIVFGNQPKGKKGGAAGSKSSAPTGKKGGVNLMRKLSGM